VELVDAFIEKLERQFQEANLKEIPAREVGEKVTEFLKEADPVAYVRFASVYRQFTTLGDFDRELKQLLPVLGQKDTIDVRFKQ